MSEPSGLEAKYPSNSFTNRPAKKERPPKVVEAVTVNPVTVQRPSLGKRFSSVFVGADARSVWQYISYDIIIPAVKDMVWEAISGGSERALFGDSARRSRGYGGGNKGGFTNYGKFSSGPNQQRPQMSSRGRARHDFKEILIETRPEAEAVLSSMYQLLETYGVVTVNDFYGICDVTGTFADEKYGWTDLRGSHVARAGRGGYVIDLPPTEVLD